MFGFSSIENKILSQTGQGDPTSSDAYVEGRHQIAEERTHAPIRVGGLNMRKTKIKLNVYTLIQDILGNSMARKHQE